MLYLSYINVIMTKCIIYVMILFNCQVPRLLMIKANFLSINLKRTCPHYLIDGRYLRSYSCYDVDVYIRIL